MSVPANDLQISEDEYLRAEETGDTRHEYVRGRVFAMVGATEAHNRLVTNLVVLIGSKLKGSPCRVFASDMKVKVESTQSFYYPDIMVSCEPYSAKSVFKKEPCLIIEVLSPSTADIDRREKLLAYQAIASLSEYAIVYQDERRIELYKRKQSGWNVCAFKANDELFLEPAPGVQMIFNLNEIYDGVV